MYVFFGMGWQSLQGTKYPFKKLFVLREVLEEEEEAALEQVEAASSTPPGGTSLSVPPSPSPPLSLFSVSSSLFQMETTFLGQVTDKNTFNMKGYEYLTVILITYHSRIGTLMTTSTKCSIK